jgi:hypothetical protein
MKKKKQPEVEMLEEGAIMISQDVSDEDFDDIEPHYTVGTPGRYAKTYMVPEEDFAYSQLLNAEKEGRATILSKQYCPCPKEGYILVLCEYDVNF